MADTEEEEKILECVPALDEPGVYFLETLSSTPLEDLTGTTPRVARVVSGDTREGFTVCRSSSEFQG